MKEPRSHSSHEPRSPVKRTVSYDKPPVKEQAVEACPQLRKQSPKDVSPHGDDKLKMKRPPPTIQPKGKKTPVFSRQNNRQLIKNAITNVCLAGEPNKKRREEVLQALGSIPADRNVIVLFKDITVGRQVRIFAV